MSLPRIATDVMPEPVMALKAYSVVKPIQSPSQVSPPTFAAKHLQQRERLRTDQLGRVSLTHLSEAEDASVTRVSATEEQ